MTSAIRGSSMWMLGRFWKLKPHPRLNGGKIMSTGLICTENWPPRLLAGGNTKGIETGFRNSVQNTGADDAFQLEY